MANALSNHGGVPAFSEKFVRICSWFGEFSSSEQLILLYTLFYKLSMAETRFLINVLEKRAQTEPIDPSFIVLEKEANDAGECKTNALSRVRTFQPLFYWWI